MTKLNSKIKLSVSFNSSLQFWNFEISVVLYFLVPNFDPHPIVTSKSEQ